MDNNWKHESSAYRERPTRRNVSNRELREKKKEFKRAAALGSEQTRESKTFYDLVESKDPRVVAASAAYKALKDEDKRLARSFAAGFTPSVPAGLRYEEFRTPEGGYKDTETMEARNSGALQPEVETLLSGEDGEEEVLVRRPAIPYDWPPRLTWAIEKLYTWPTRGVACVKSLSLKREGARCHLVVDGESQGSWLVTRKTESDVLTNIFSIALWGTTDIPISALDSKTPDSYNSETSTAYEMKVSRRAIGHFDANRVVDDAVKKYSPYAPGGVRVVLVRMGKVWSNYEWPEDSHSVDGGHTFVCCMQSEATLHAAFAKLFDSPSYGGQKRIADYGSAPLVKPPDYDEDQHNYLKPHHERKLAQLAEKSEDGLSWAEIREIVDDEQSQAEKAVSYLRRIAEATSKRNDYLNDRGQFRAKCTSFPLFGYVEGYNPEILFKPNADCDTPHLMSQDEGTTEDALKKLFDIVHKERHPGPSPSEAQIEAKRRWESVDPRVQFEKSLKTELIINEDKITKLMAELMTLRASEYLTKDDLKSRRASILDRISELVYVSVEARVKRARKCVMSAPEKIQGSTDLYSETDAVSSGFLESSYLSKKRGEKRQHERSTPELYMASQKNLPYVDDPEFDRRMEAPLGPSLAPETASKSVIDSMGMGEVGRDSNYDLAFTMDKVSQECNVSLGHKTGPGIFIKPIPHCRAWLMMRNSGQQAICYLVVDTTVHTLDEARWWHEIEHTTLVRSKPFTISKAKAEMYINAEETLRVLNCQREMELREETLDQDQLTRSKTIFSNLVLMILATQRQPDSIILSYARYIGMILRNNNFNRGPVGDIFTKVERIKSRLSLWTLKKFVSWVRDREATAVEELFLVDGKRAGMSHWQPKCWMTLYPTVSGSAAATSYYVGNIYAKTLGENAAANRGPAEKLLNLAYKAADGKEKNLRKPWKGVNKICEELPSYTGHYQVDYGLLKKVLDKSWSRHEEKHPGWKKDFETEFERITTRADGQRYATNRSSMEHHSDSSLDGYRVLNEQSGRVQTTNIRSRNRTRKMKHMVAKYPKVFLGHPLKDLSRLWSKTRVYMVPKKQLQGKREILILTPGGRLFISSLESIMRGIADGMENEVLTNKHKEEKISSYASYVNMKRSKLIGKVRFEHICSRSSADATKWCQLFRMSVFMVMTEAILRKAYPNLADHCLSVLYEHVQKKIQIPPTILREIMAGNPFNEESLQRLADEFRKNTSVHNMGECMVKIVDNMLQGILHYTSSVFHSLVQNYFTDRVREVMDEKMLEIAVEHFAPEHRAEASLMMSHFNARAERVKETEDRMWSQGMMREEIDKALLKLKSDTDASREWLIRHIVGRQSDRLVPSWDFSYQNAASSDDTSIAMDIIITGPSAFLKKARKMAIFIFTKMVKAKRLYYMRLGIEESISKSSVGNFRDEMEFNSKWYEGPVVIDVVLKQVLSALRAPMVTGLGLMQTHYVNGRNAVIGVGGSVELVKQIEIAQARLHWKILGCDMSDMFPMLLESILRNPHPLVGMFTHEKNPALAGLMPEFMIRYQWLQDKATAETEQSLSMSVDHEMDPSGIVTVSLKIEVGNGLRSKESMMESEEVCDRFVKTVLGSESPDKYLEDNALSFLSGTASSTAKLLLELVKDKTRPIETDAGSTSVYRLSTLLIAAPCMSVKLPPAEGEARRTLRMSLPGVLRLVEESKLAAVEKNVRLLDTMCSNESFSKKLSGLRVGPGQTLDRSFANRAVSTTRQTMAGVPAELEHKTMLFRLWSGSSEPEVLAAYKQIRGYLPDVRKTMESSIERMRGYRVTTKMALVTHVTAKADLVYTVRSRGGTGMYSGVYDAIVKVLEVQSYQSKVCDVYQAYDAAAEEEEGLDEFRFECNVGAFFTNPRRLGLALSACHIPDPLSPSCPRDLKLLAWAQTVLAGAERRDILRNATSKTPLVISLGSRGRLILVAGPYFLQLNITQDEKSARVNSCETNANQHMLTYLFSALRPEKKKWLAWPGQLEPDEATYYYKPVDGLSTAPHPGTTPVWYTKNERAWAFTELVPIYRKFGGKTRISLRLGNPDRKWDTVELNIPIGPTIPTNEQRAWLRTSCDLKAVHYNTMDLICRGNNLTHYDLNEWYDKAKYLKSAWRILMHRSTRLIQMGGISFMRWEDAQVHVNGKELWKLPAFQGTSFSGTKPEKESEDFAIHSERLKMRLRLKGYPEAEITSMISEGESNADAPADTFNWAAYFDDDDDDSGLVAIDYSPETGADGVDYDETFAEIQAVEYVPRAIDVTLSTGMPIESFGDILTRTYRSSTEGHRGAFYLTQADQDSDDEGEL